MSEPIKKDETTVEETTDAKTTTTTHTEAGKPEVQKEETVIEKK